MGDARRRCRRCAADRCRSRSSCLVRRQPRWPRNSPPATSPKCSSPSIRHLRSTHPTPGRRRLRGIVEQVTPTLRGAAAHLSDPRLRADAGRATAQAADHRRDGHHWHRGGCALHASDVPGKAGRGGSSGGRRTGIRDDPDRRVSRRRRASWQRVRRAVSTMDVQIDEVEDSSEAGGAVPGGEAGGRSRSGRTDRRGRPRDQEPGEPADCREAGHGDGRRTGGVATDLRQRLAADGAADRQLRPDGRAETLRRARHLRSDPAPGRA